MEIEQNPCEHPMGQRNKKEKNYFETKMEKQQQTKTYGMEQKTVLRRKFISDKYLH